VSTSTWMSVPRQFQSNVDVVMAAGLSGSGAGMIRRTRFGRLAQTGSVGDGGYLPMTFSAAVIKLISGFCPQ
jgi:hypothetical protein